MNAAELIEALTIGAPDALTEAVQHLLQDPSRADPAHVELARRRLTRIGFELDDADELARLKPLRERFFSAFGR